MTQLSRADVVDTHGHTDIFAPNIGLHLDKVHFTQHQGCEIHLIVQSAKLDLSKYLWSEAQSADLQAESRTDCNSEKEAEMSLKEEESLQAVSFFNVSNILTSIFLTTVKILCFSGQNQWLWVFWQRLNNKWMPGFFFALGFINHLDQINLKGTQIRSYSTHVNDSRPFGTY